MNERRECHCKEWNVIRMIGVREVKIAVVVDDDDGGDGDILLG